MILEETLNQLMTEHKIDCFKVYNALEELESLSVTLGINNINELIRFVKLNNINSIFYNYYFYDKSKFLIDEDYKEQLVNAFNEAARSKDFLSSIKYSLNTIETDVTKYNKKIESIDFSKPMLLYVFAIYQGRYISVIYKDSWYDDLNMLSPEEKLHELLDSQMDLIYKNKEQDKQNRENLMNEFKNYVFNDNEFEDCTNPTLRRTYMQTVFDKEEAKKYKSLFTEGELSGETVFDIGNLFVFNERLWKEYKEHKSKIK